MIYAINITKKNISKAINFCLSYEEYSVNLISFLRQEEKRFFNNFKESKLFYSDEKIIGVASINTHNFFIYCFIFCNEEVCKLVASTFNFNSTYAIMGEASFQKQLLIFLEKTLNIKVKTIIPYVLMIKLKEEAIIHSNALMNNVKILKASWNDANSLLDLQVGYESEEVCQGKSEFPKAISLMNLENILKDEILYFARVDNLCVSKANTNARGVNYAQIGGVYTLPQYRKQGIASCVLTSLIEHINKKENKNVSLFVKTNNTKAIEMYKRLGLKERGKFSISYFR